MKRLLASTCGAALALWIGVAWSGPGDGDELGGGEPPPPPPGEDTTPAPSDELGGGEQPRPPAVDEPAGGGASDELGGGEKKEPPPEPPKEPPPPPAEPPKEPPPEPPADPNAPPAEPDPDSVDGVIAAEEKAKKEAARIKLIVAEFNKAMKGTPDAQQKALTDISQTKHDLVAEALIPWIKPDVDESIRDLAIEVAKAQRSPKIAAAAMNLFDSNHTKNFKYARSMINIIAKSKDKKHVSKLRSIMKGKEYHLEVKKEAVAALGFIGHRDAVPDLIALARELENPHLPAKDKPRKDALEKLVFEALKLISGGQDFPDSRGWALWWKANEKTFGVEPEAPK